MLGAIHLKTAESTNTWCDGEIALGRKLVSTVPEDRYDEQPVLTEDRRYLVVADLRLDDRDGLARELSRRPNDLANLSDAAVAALCLERWHEAAFDRLVGVFAIAAWDRRERRLLLARDFLGARPLFYHQGTRLFGFASMPAGLHALPQVPKGADYEAMVDALALFAPRSPRSPYRDIQRVMPGHYCVVDAKGEVRQTRFWRPNLEPLRLKTHADYVEGLREHLDQAVAAQLRGSGGRVAAHLTAGFDSSAVTTAAARLMQDEAGRITAFTACPREGYAAPGGLRAIADEGPIAAATAALYPNIEHVIVRTTGRSALDEIDRASTLYGGPMFNLCNLVWSDLIHDEAQRRGLKVLLTGTMGNASLSYSGRAALPELFAKGRLSDWLRLARAQRRSRLTHWRGVAWNTVAPWVPGPMFSALQRLSGRGGPDTSRYTALRRDLLRRLYAEAAAADTGDNLVQQSLDYFERPFQNGQAERLATLAGDPGPIYKGVLGWWGLDTRDPTADRRLVEFSLRIPTEQFMYGGVPKALIRNALAGRAPPEMLKVGPRGYQAADWHEELTRVRERLKMEVENIALHPETQDLIDVERLQSLVDNWPSDGWGREEVIADYRLSLLRAVSVANFVRRASGANY